MQPQATRLHLSCVQLQCQHLWMLLLVALLLLLQMDELTCRHLAASSKRMPLSEMDTTIDTDSSAAGEVVDKRTLISGSGTSAGGQPEEIFSLNDRLESNYDEYPMIVPKRAALLLDRLMVALHHALEKERHRIGDFYGNKSNVGGFKSTHRAGKILPTADKQPTIHELQEQELELEAVPMQYNMYSDDDPSVIMDYDFKDLNSINRATGETLMGKSFQRRANAHMGEFVGTQQKVGGGGGGGGGVAMLTSAATATMATASGAGSGGGGGGGGSVGANRKNVGRLYWRCYFNAISCF